MCDFMPVILLLKRLGQEDQESKTSMGWLHDLTSSQCMVSLCTLAEPGFLFTCEVMNVNV